MAIAFKCKCGRSMKVRDDNAGKMVRCPDCGAGVRIPPLEPTSEDEMRALKTWAKGVDKAQREQERATPYPPTKKPTPPPATTSGAHRTAPTPLPKTVATRMDGENTENGVPRSIVVGVLVGVAVIGGLVWFIWLR